MSFRQMPSEIPLLYFSNHQRDNIRGGGYGGTIGFPKKIL